MSKKEKASNRCTATRNDGAPCRAWAVTASDPPRCSAHGGGKRRANPVSAATLDLYRKPRRPIKTADDALVHMAECLDQVAEYIDQHRDTLEPDQMARLQAVRGQNLSRFARMHQERARSATGGGDPADSFFDRALSKAAETLGVDLSAT